jgi:hypothetical protein
MIAQVASVFQQHLTLTDAVRAGARAAVVSRFAPDPTGAAKAATARAGSDIGLTAADVTVAASWQPGTDVTVTATHDYTISIIGFPLTSGVLHSSTTERVE